MRLKAVDQHLCQHYICSGDWLFQDKRPHEILFRENLSDPACLAAMEAYAAYDLARLGQCAAILALAKRVESIRLINVALDDPGMAYRDSTLGAILGAIAVDVQPASLAIRAQHRLEAGVHVAGLTRLVANRGVARLPPWLQIFYHWMDIQLGGVLSAADHALPRPRFGGIDRPTEASKKPFAVHRVNAGSLIDELFSPPAAFHRLLTDTSIERPNARMAALVLGVMIVLECSHSVEAVRIEFQRSTLLMRLLATGEGTSDSLNFALFTVDRGETSHALRSAEQAVSCAKRLFAWNRMAWHARQQLEVGMLGTLIARTSFDLEAIWEPERFKALLQND